MDGHSSIVPMLGLSALVSYFVMSNVMLTFGNGVYNHLNKAYMALLMAATMGVIMSILARNKMGILVSSASSVLILGLIRNQEAIDDKSFTKAMIEHHDAAIFMSQKIEKRTHSPFIKKLANDIQKTQTEEIKEMKNWLDQLG